MTNRQETSTRSMTYNELDGKGTGDRWRLLGLNTTEDFTSLFLLLLCGSKLNSTKERLIKLQGHEQKVSMFLIYKLKPNN